MGVFPRVKLQTKAILKNSGGGDQKFRIMNVGLKEKKDSFGLNSC